ncbi:general secretion pathway protein D [Granulicella aggregans]|uniref:General secretion pathway protein D n=1 Tax=Granulicella aggregans TaxID=474949 RepID=A0A7W7ZF31_9BACT|nr:type II and III secretion system protein [Granulicella aggregans]MBB5058734.1 general secretion pathway protein D [Granulicella aggregans]
MIPVRFKLCLVLIGFVSLPVYSQRPESSYKAGVRAEAKGHLDAAYLAFKAAHDKKPNEPKYLAAYLKARLYASSDHVQKGQSLRDVYKLEDALVEFRRAAEIDSSNFSAFQEIRRTEDLIQRREAEQNQSVQVKTQISQLEKQAGSAAGPVSITFPSNNDITLHLVTTVDMVYKTLGKLAGFNVLIDPEYKPQKIQMELKDVNVRDALSMVALQSKTFWRPVSSNTILVSADNSGKRKEIEQNVMRTFYLKNAATPADLQQAASTLKGILDITRIQTTPEQRSLTIRGTPDQMVLAQKLLLDIDKPRSEVMIEIAVLEISKGRIQTLGINPPTSVSATLQPSGTTSTSTTGTTTTGTTSSGFTLNSFAYLTANNVQISIPGASLTALLSDSNTKVLQKPQIRAMDSEKATLKIGDRIPIATGSYQSGLSNGVNTQFTYIDVGVNVDIVPYIHSNREVTLKMSFEISSVTGEQTVDGVTEPTIGQRRIEHQARLRDGEVNLIGGILQDTESHSLSGYPFLARLPLLKYLFGQENKDHQQSEIVFAITPHIIRSNEVNDDNEKMVDIGTGSSIAYRTIQPADNSAKPATPTVPTPAMPAPAVPQPLKP